MIASENYCSSAVLEANGTVLVNKYSEGYPGKRYYEGNEIIDEVEILAQSRARDLFGVEHVNVQPYSGSPANLAIYLAFLQPGDTVMGLSLPAGGHLTHGWSVSATGSLVQRGALRRRPRQRRVDMDEVRALALEHRPKLLFCGGTAVPRVIDFPAFAAIAQEVGALMVADVVAHRGADRRWRAPLAGAPRGRDHDHHPQDAARAARRDPDVSRGVRQSARPRRLPRSSGRAPPAADRCHRRRLGEAATPAFGDYAHQVVANAKALAEGLLERGFALVSGGTDNHLILIDMTSKGVSGKQASRALVQAGIVTNANAIPFDPRKPLTPPVCASAPPRPPRAACSPSTCRRSLAGSTRSWTPPATATARPSRASRARSTRSWSSSRHRASGRWRPPQPASR